MPHTETYLNGVLIETIDTRTPEEIKENDIVTANVNFINSVAGGYPDSQTGITIPIDDSSRSTLSQYREHLTLSETPDTYVVPIIDAAGEIHNLPFSEIKALLLRAGSYYQLLRFQLAQQVKAIKDGNSN